MSAKVLHERFARFLLLSAECLEEMEHEFPGLNTQAHEALDVASKQSDRETVSVEAFQARASFVDLDAC